MVPDPGQTVVGGNGYPLRGDAILFVDPLVSSGRTVVVYSN
jgi:hypothetical protein